MKLKIIGNSSKLQVVPDSDFESSRGLCHHGEDFGDPVKDLWGLQGDFLGLQGKTFGLLGE